MSLTKAQAIELQGLLVARGFDLKVDGDYGPATHAAAVSAIMASAPVVPEAAKGRSLAWGRKVSGTFRARVIWIADELRMPASGADWLMACIAWESDETFAPDVTNKAGSGATGLIQFMPSTARGLATSTAALAELTAEDQLRFVFRYFEPYKGRLNSLGDVYMAILWPKGVGKPDSWPLWDRDEMPTTFRQNAGLDVNRDGQITKAECIGKVQEKLVKGMRPEYRWQA